MDLGKATYLVLRNIFFNWERGQEIFLILVGWMGKFVWKSCGDTSRLYNVQLKLLLKKNLVLKILSGIV